MERIIVDCRLAQHTTQKNHAGSNELEQPEMMGDLCVAEPAHIGATASASVRSRNEGRCGHSGPRRIILLVEDMPRGIHLRDGISTMVDRQRLGSLGLPTRRVDRRTPTKEVSWQLPPKSLVYASHEERADTQRSTGCRCSTILWQDVVHHKRVQPFYASGIRKRSSMPDARRIR
jgi:hypothetical protein